MNGVRLISSMAVFFFLLRARFSTAIEERAAKSAVPKFEDDEVQPGDFPYLALVKYGDEYDEYCSGSILSKSTVLTYCTSNATITTLYAGLVYVSEWAYPIYNIQVRQVTRVAEHPKMKDLKIFYPNESWEFTENVTSITLHLNEKRRSTAVNCSVVGFGIGDAYKMEQEIGGISQCHLNDSTPGMLYSKSDMPLSVIDPGGPVVCQGEQWAISAETLRWAVTPEPTEPPAEGGDEPSYTDNLHCNTYLDVAFYRSWILDNIKESPSSTDSIHRFSVKISMNQALLYPALWLLLLMTVELLYLN